MLYKASDGYKDPSKAKDTPNPIPKREGNTNCP